MLEWAESEWCCWSAIRLHELMLEWAESEWCWNGQRAGDVGMGRERVVLECVESE